MNFNRASLIGYLGTNAEVKTAHNNKEYVVLSIATQNRWKDSNEEYQSRTEWHRVYGWGNLSRFAKTLLKGEHVFIEGEIRYREYTKEVGKGRSKETVKMRVAEIHASNIMRLDPRAAAGEDTAPLNDAAPELD
jgi:single-strand DNA-binding protein